MGAKLLLPQAVTVNDLIGGYMSDASYTLLGDNQTNDARNVEITRKGTIRERLGYDRLLNCKLNNDIIDPATTGTGRSVTGFYQLIKSNGNKYMVAGAGDSLYAYTSATAVRIADGLEDDPNVFWSVVQIQDPRSATNEVLVMANGIDPLKIWEGSSVTAANLSAVTDFGSVPRAKFLASMKGRIFACNHLDAADVDSDKKFSWSGFNSATLAPLPQNFDASSNGGFGYVGGSDEYGAINGAAVLREQLILFKERATYKFIFGANPLDSELVQMDQHIGCIAPYSVATVGNFIMFLSELGVYAFDGNVFKYIGKPIEGDIEDISTGRRRYAKGIYVKEKNQYWLSISTGGKSYNDTVFIFDLTKNVWFPPYTNMNANVLGTLIDANDQESPMGGDHLGYIYKHFQGTADGRSDGYTGYTLSSVSATITLPVGTGLDTTHDGLRGVIFRVIEGTGKNIEQLIVSNTSETVTLSDEITILDTSSEFTIGAIDSHFRTKDYDYGAADVDKKFRKVYLRTTQQGNHNLIVHYFINFKPIARATLVHIRLLLDALAFGYNGFGAVWGGATEIRSTISLRSTPTQSLTGKYFSLRFSNEYPNQPWEIYGFDTILTPVGRR